MGDMYSAERFPRLVRALPLEGHKAAMLAISCDFRGGFTVV
jgi:hypothetical protein